MTLNSARRLPTVRVRSALSAALELWPLLLFWFAREGTHGLWRDVLTSIPDRTGRLYAFAFHAWAAATLTGPVVFLVAAVAMRKMRLASRVLPVAAMLGVVLATGLALSDEARHLAPYLGHAKLLGIAKALDVGVLWALGLGVFSIAVAAQLLFGSPGFRRGKTKVLRGKSDNHGHADWLSMDGARELFPGVDPAYGGIVVGEAYRVDRDDVARQGFDPTDPKTWGRGGSSPLLVDPCRSGATHAMVVAGSGGYKTTSVGVPTLLSWTASAVVLDPSREVAPMVERFRRERLGHRTITLDPSAPQGDGFNVLDWIDIASPLAEANVEAVVGWITGETKGRVTSGAEFFRESAKGLIACVIADTLWDPALPDGQKTLAHVRQVLVTPEGEMRKVLKAIHATSASSLARDLAGSLMGLVDETFSGVYANAAKDTRWLSTPAFARLVSGSTFRSAEVNAGKLTVFVQIPLKTLQATPALGRIVIGALLNAVYEADGHVRGRVLFLLDEVARLGFMGVIEAARDAGRKYGITLLLLYQSLGQVTEQWGREGLRAWYDSTSWRLFAAIQDPETARELSALCGEHGVVATAQGDTQGTQGRAGALGSKSSGHSQNRSEIKRALIRPDELLQDTRADEAFVIVRGSKPLRCGRAIYFRRPGMAAQVRASHFHAKPRLRPSTAAE